MGNPTEFPKIDIEDEYPICNLEYDKNRFTDDFFEYEQGQKEIIVKHRLRDHIDFWKSINANDFIIDTIFNGYKIPFYSLPPVSFSKNNKSALLESKFVSEAIRDLLDRGLVTESEHIPTVVNPLTVSIQSNGKRRLILDLRLVSMHIWKQSVKYDDIRIALLYLKQGSWMIKFDIHSAYHFLDIYPPHTQFLGFSWVVDGVTKFYRFLVLPFGLSSAPYIFTKLTRPLIAKWRGEGKSVLMFLDGFGTADNFIDTDRIAQEIKFDLLSAGFIPKADKSCWIPTQELQWLGTLLNCLEFYIEIPEKRIKKALGTLEYLLSFKFVPVRKVASFVGQIIFMYIVVGTVCQIMTKSLSINITKAISWNSYIQLSDESKAQLLFWKKSLFQLNKKSLKCLNTCSRIVYSDASNSGYAGYEVNTYKGIVHGMWDSQESAQSSTWRELCAVYRVLISLQDVLRCQRVK